MNSSDYEILNWDSDFFGFGVARITAGTLKPEKLKRLIDFLKSLSVRLVYWETDPKDIASQSAAQAMGGLLVDHRLVYQQKVKRKTSNIKFPEVEEINTSEPDKDLIDLAITSGEFSRFRTDQQIQEYQFRDLYESWIRKSVNKQIADSVLVIRNNKRIVGFVSLKKEGGYGKVGLISVDESVRRQGIGLKLIKSALFWFQEHGCKMACVVTQAENHSACALYKKSGFSIEKELNIYHFWIQ